MQVQILVINKAVIMNLQLSIFRPFRASIQFAFNTRGFTPRYILPPFQGCLGAGELSNFLADVVPGFSNQSGSVLIFTAAIFVFNYAASICVSDR
jgi:hypothetical protein